MLAQLYSSKRKVVNPVKKFRFVLNEAGRSLNFISLAGTIIDSEVTEATQLIEVNIGLHTQPYTAQNLHHLFVFVSFSLVALENCFHH